MGAGAVIHIRDATTRDAKNIYAVHLSDNAADQWVDEEDCGDHTEWMIRLGVPPVVAEVDGRLVGEMKVWWGEDVPEFGKTLDISTLQVHRDFQGRGVGSALTQRAIEISRTLGCDATTVWTIDAEGFYRKHGFGLKLVQQRLSIDTRQAPPAEEYEIQAVAPGSLDPPDGRRLRTHRILHPRQLWNDLVRQGNARIQAQDGGRAPAIQAFRVLGPGLGQGAVAVYRRFYWSNEAEKAELYLWSPVWSSVLLSACAAHARALEIETLSVLAHGDVAEAPDGPGAVLPGEEVRIYTRPNAR